MPTPRSAFLVVRSLSDVERVCHQLTAYLSMRRQRSGGSTIVVQGILIDPSTVATPPATLDVPTASDTRRLVRVVETLGLDGVWALCCLEEPVATSLLAAALRRGARTDTPQLLGASGPRFIPLPTGEPVVEDTTLPTADRREPPARPATTRVARQGGPARVIPLVRRDAH